MLFLISPDCFLSLMMLAMRRFGTKHKDLSSAAPGKYDSREAFLEAGNRSLSCSPSGFQSFRLSKSLTKHLWKRISVFLRPNPVTRDPSVSRATGMDPLDYGIDNRWLLALLAGSS